MTRELRVVDHAQWQRTFHLDRLSVEIGRQMSGIGQGDGAIGCDAHGETGGVRFAAAEQPPVQRLKDEQRIGIDFRSHADGADQQRHQHAGLQAFAGHIAGHNQQAAVGGCGMIW